MKSFAIYLREYWNMTIPDYPVQLDPKKDKGGWVTGDPPKPIDFSSRPAGNAKSILKKASNQIKRDRS